MARIPVTRRDFMIASTALGVASAMEPRPVWSATNNVLSVRHFSEAQVLDPAFGTSLNEHHISLCLFNRLVTHKTGDVWGWELDAAESIDQVDATHVKFTLRPGIVWSNGFGEMTAEDVKYSFERILNPELESNYVADWEALDHVEITDKYSGVMIFKYPYAPLWTSTLPFKPATIVCKKAMEALPEKKFTTEPPATSGPYVIKDWAHKQRMVLARNPDWNGPRPDFDEIHIFPIDSEASAEIGFEAGDIDFTDISLPTLAKYRKEPPAGATVIEMPSLRYVWLGINADNPQFTDIRVRKAVQWSIDVSAILEAAYDGLAAPSYGIIAPGLIGHRDYNFAPAKPDYDGAKELLAEAGYPDGFKCTLHVLNKPTFMTGCQVIQANLANIGIEVEIVPLEGGMFWSLGNESKGDTWKDVQLIYNRFSTAPEPAWTTMWFTCDEVGTWNWERVCNPEFDKLHDQAMREFDPEKRHESYVRMQDMMEESGSYRFITHEITGIVYRDTIVPALLPDGSPRYTLFRQA